MNTRMNARLVALCLSAVVLVGPRSALAAGPADLMKHMPSDFTVSVVVVDFAKLDKSIAGVVKRIDPKNDDPGILESFKEELPIGKWIDFTKPIGFAGRGFGPNSKPVLWAAVPDFAGKVKTIEGAKEEEGVWLVPSEGDEPMFAKVRGDYLVASPDKALLTQALKEGKSLADEVQSRMDLLRDRDVFVHLNFESIRPMAAAGLAQAAQMVPMMAMMAAAQGGAGADATAITNLANALVEMAKQFVDQVAYIELVLGVNDKAADLTLATGYREGGIRNYLAKQKPASAPLLSEIEEQPFFLAFGCHVPGTEPGFIDYVCDRLESALKAPAAAPAGTPPGESAEKPAAPANDALKESLKSHRELYRKIEGWNMVMAMTPGGMKFTGDYMGSDANGILKLAKETMTAPSPFMPGPGSGSYESKGTKKIGSANVEELAMKLDKLPPGSDVFVKQLFGENPRVLLGVAGDRVRMCTGSDEDAQKVFSGKVSKPLSSSQYVKEAMEGLPAKRNMVLLLDPAGIIPLLAPMMGGAPMEPIPPGPPASISVSISGEPARVDFHVPIRTIERVKQAVAPNEPM